MPRLLSPHSNVEMRQFELKGLGLLGAALYTQREGGGLFYLGISFRRPKAVSKPLSGQNHGVISEASDSNVAERVETFGRIYAAAKKGLTEKTYSGPINLSLLVKTAPYSRVLAVPETADVSVYGHTQTVMSYVADAYRMALHVHFLEVPNGTPALCACSSASAPLFFSTGVYGHTTIRTRVAANVSFRTTNFRPSRAPRYGNFREQASHEGRAALSP